MKELQAELSARKKELQNLEDAETELMMLDDEDAEAVPIQVRWAEYLLSNMWVIVKFHNVTE